MIQKYCGQLKSVAYIPHGIDREFAETHYTRQWPQSGEDEIHCIYVSNASLYKYQWNVVRAIAGLRRRGYNLTLSLVGGGKGPAQQLLSETIEACDSEGLFIRQFPFIPHKDIPKLVASSDIFIFASGCENMPVTLLEGMAVGLPIACSNRGPMPEILADGGEYFDPEEEMSIASAVERIIADSDARETLAKRAKSLSSKYSWEKCADETWDFIVTTYGRTTR